MANDPLVQLELKNLPLLGRGKVRDIFAAGENMLLVATDRISAFDFILPSAIPGKGRVLTALSLFWFRRIESIVPHHLISDDMTQVEGLSPEEADLLQGRALLVKKAEPLQAEFIVRGYLAGSGWKDYQRTGKVCGIELPADMRESAQIDPPILTPSTKAESGHDENISMDQLKEIIGPRWAEEAFDAALKIYIHASEHARKQGIILCDTKFEFGVYDGRLMLIDEVLTPDSSRFWPEQDYEPGRSQQSFDKQYVRDYLLNCDWDRKSPPPVLPAEVVANTQARYEEALKRITAAQ